MMYPSLINNHGLPTLTKKHIIKDNGKHMKTRGSSHSFIRHDPMTIEYSCTVLIQ